jgi:hypothetical protein
MSTYSDNSNNTLEECSDEENLQIQLDDDIYISDLEDVSIEIEQIDEEIMQAIQNISFDEVVAINEENLEKALELSQQAKLISRVESDVWKFVDKETRQCSKCSKIFKPKTATSSIRIHLQHKHELLLKKDLDSISKKYSPKIQAEKTQAILNWIILTLKLFKVVEEKAFII